MNIIRLKAMEKRRLPPKLTALKQLSLAKANALLRANIGMTANEALDAVLNLEV